jgi:hypothetical protein
MRRETSARETSIRETSIRETSARETSIRETSIRETSIRETSIRETSTRAHTRQTLTRRGDGTFVQWSRYSGHRVCLLRDRAWPRLSGQFTRYHQFVQLPDVNTLYVLAKKVFKEPGMSGWAPWDAAL